MIKQKKECITGYLFIFPAFACLGAFRLFPVLRNLYLSFMTWDMVIGDPKFVGLKNYIKLFTASDFYASLEVTFRYTILYVPISMLFGYILAILMIKKTKWNVLFRTALFVPYVTSMVAMSAVFIYILHPQYGTLNVILNDLGFASVPWLNQKSTALYCLVAMNIWKSTGFCAVIYLGGILNISEEILEAAQIDGSSWWNTLVHIKTPLVAPTTFMLTIMLTIESFKIFTQINVMTGGGPDKSTTNLLTYMFNQAFDNFSVGYGSAIATVLLLIVLLINFIQLFFERFVNYD